jgi:hypothetical protein
MRMFPLSSLTNRCNSPVCVAVRFSGPAVWITVEDGIKLLSCLIYASVPVSNKDSLVLKSFALDFISFDVIIFVAAGIAIRSESVSFSSTFCLQIVLSVVENLFNTHHPPCLQTYDKETNPVKEKQ